jgi:hypothetical protein
MQIKPSFQIYKVLLKILFLSWKLVSTALKCCVEFYRILGFGFISFEACLEKLFKFMKTENRKKEIQKKESDWPDRTSRVRPSQPNARTSRSPPPHGGPPRPPQRPNSQRPLSLLPFFFCWHTGPTCQGRHLPLGRAPLSHGVAPSRPMRLARETRRWPKTLTLGTPSLSPLTLTVRSESSDPD